MFYNSVIDYWKENTETVFKKQRDIDIAYSIIDLMDRVEVLKSLIKKLLYILLREISGAKTQHITKVLNTMKSHYKEPRETMGHRRSHRTTKIK